MTNNEHYFQCKIYIFASLLTVTSTFVFWPLTPLWIVQINTYCLSKYHVATCNWTSQSKFSVFDCHISSNLTQVKIFCVLSVTLYVESDPENNQFEFRGNTAALCIENSMVIDDVTVRTMLDILWILNNVFGKKNWPFYRQFGSKYNRACIGDGIIYHFINFRKVWQP